MQPAIICRHELAEAAWAQAELVPPVCLPLVPEAGSAPAAQDWARLLRSLAGQCRQAVDVLAEALICDPALSLKFAYGLLLPTVAYSFATFAERAEVFGEPISELGVSLDDLRKAAEVLPKRSRPVPAMRGEVLIRLRSLAEDSRAVAAAIPFSWDEATRGEALKLAAELEAACDEIGAMDADADVGVPIPARSADLIVKPLGLEKQAPASPQDKAARGLHNFIFEAELGALELSAENILLGAAMPRQFVIDMAVQCFDEARHASALLARLPQYGARAGTYPVSLKLWTHSRGLSLPQRLAVHQRLGEWIGVDSLISASSEFLDRGDVVTAHLMQFMARDEVRHVGYGNKWLRWFEDKGLLTVDEIDRWATEYRDSYGQGIKNFSALPLNEKECVEAGFTAREIELLKQARLGSAEEGDTASLAIVIRS